MNSKRFLLMVVGAALIFAASAFAAETEKEIMCKNSYLRESINKLQTEKDHLAMRGDKPSKKEIAKDKTADPLSLDQNYE